MSIEAPNGLTSSEIEQYNRFIETCSDQELIILNALLVKLKQHVDAGDLPHIGAFLVAGCADPGKSGHRKDIDLRITTETDAGTDQRQQAIDALRSTIPKFFREHQIGCTVNGPNSGIPRYVEVRVGGKPMQMLFGPTASDIVTQAQDEIRIFDIFVQSSGDPPLSLHPYAEKAIGAFYIPLLDTR